MPEILDHKERKARKDHICDYCGCIIRKGDTYDWCKLKWENQIYEWKSHMECITIATELLDYIDPDDNGITTDRFMEVCSDFCEEFICHDCEQDRYECNNPYCIDKIAAKLETHRMVRCKDNPWAFRLEERR